MWPNARISVMGGEQAAAVLATVRRDNLEARGESWSKQDEESSRRRSVPNTKPKAILICQRAAVDDGIIDPLDTRRLLALAISASLNAPIGKTQFGIFRM